MAVKYIGRPLVTGGASYIVSHTVVKLIEADYLIVILPRFVTFGIFEPDVTKYLLRNLNENDNCCDVGANFGYYSCLMARRARLGKTVALEADPIVSILTQDNLAINWINNAIVHNLAVSEKIGDCTLYRRHKRSGNTSIIHLADSDLAKMNELPSESFNIESCTLDEIVRRDLGGRVNFVKIDVEGSEPLVLRGATSTLQSNPTIKIVMEWSPSQISAAGFSVQDFVAEMVRMGLSFSLLDQDGKCLLIKPDDLLKLKYGNLLLMLH